MLPTDRFLAMRSTFDDPMTRELVAFRRQIRRMLGEDMTDPEAEPVGWNPSVDLTESDKEFVLSADLPGIKPGDVTVECHDGTLTIRGEKSEERKETGEKNRWHVYERSYGNFYRSFGLPKFVDGTKASAKFLNGVLTVRVPKAPETKPAVHKVAIEIA